MIMTTRKGLAAAALACSIALFANADAFADPPGRVARIAQVSGAVSFSPAGEDDWVPVELNRPMITGDRLWADAQSHAEVQMGSLVARINSETSLSILNLDDVTAQLELTQGTLNLRVRALDQGQVVEIDTPNIAFSVQRPGTYRIDVYADGGATLIAVQSGGGEAFSETASYSIGAPQAYQFDNAGIAQQAAMPAPDEFDRWCAANDLRQERSVAARYVSPELIGYSDLDNYGTWNVAPGYGNVWVPTAVAADWAPYRTGRWAWIEPWGWTWVDAAPWGFAPFHYGRWARFNNRWCWVPGPVRARPVYAPALVAFVGGGGIGWFALGPGEVYRPSYQVTSAYFTRVNVSSTNVSNVYVTNVYNNVNVNVNYRNREVVGAVTAVQASAFAQSQPITRGTVTLSHDQVLRAPVSAFAAVAPTHASVLSAGTSGRANAVQRPPAAVNERHVIARHAAPQPVASFASRQPRLDRDPGKPLDTATMASLHPEPSARAPAQRMKVVTPSPMKNPLPTASQPTSARAEAKAADRTRSDAAGSSAGFNRQGGQAATKDEAKVARPAAVAPTGQAVIKDAAKVARPAAVAPQRGATPQFNTEQHKQPERRQDARPAGGEPLQAGTSNAQPAAKIEQSPRPAEPRRESRPPQPGQAAQPAEPQRQARPPQPSQPAPPAEARREARPPPQPSQAAQPAQPAQTVAPRGFHPANPEAEKAAPKKDEPGPKENKARQEPKKEKEKEQ